MWPFKKKRVRWSDENLDLLHELVKTHTDMLDDLIRHVDAVTVMEADKGLPKLADRIRITQKEAKP